MGNGLANSRQKDWSISKRFQLYHLCVECFCFTQHGLSFTVIFSQPVTCRPETDLYFDTDFQRVSPIFQVSGHDMTKVNTFSGITKVTVTFFDFTVNISLKRFFENVNPLPMALSFLVVFMIF